MYGTVARLKTKPGQREVITAMLEQTGGQLDPGEVTAHFFSLDSDPDGLVLVAVFESKEAYVANSKRSETHERYMQLRSLLAADPEWLDGSVFTQSA
jgi:quinol monooxygenase YgiN